MWIEKATNQLWCFTVAIKRFLFFCRMCPFLFYLDGALKSEDLWKSQPSKSPQISHRHKNADQVKIRSLVLSVTWRRQSCRRGHPATAVQKHCAVSSSLSVGCGDLQKYNKAAAQTRSACLHTLQSPGFYPFHISSFYWVPCSAHSSHAPTILQST